MVKISRFVLAGVVAMSSGMALAAGACSTSVPQAKMQGMTTAFQEAAAPTYTPLRDLTNRVYPGRTPRQGLSDLSGLVMGLTMAQWTYGYRVDIARGIDAKSAPCYSITNVVYEVGMKPMVVHIAKEIKGGPCLTSFVWEHEQEHVALNRKYHEDGQARVAAYLQKKLASFRPSATSSPGEMQKEADAFVSGTINDVLQEIRLESVQQHRHLDDHLDARSFYDTCPQEVTSVVQQLAAE